SMQIVPYNVYIVNILEKINYVSRNTKRRFPNTFVFFPISLLIYYIPISPSQF
ncbi:hypothetical protein L9F63_025316, partial [Diploptera punctata]